MKSLLLASLGGALALGACIPLEAAQSGKVYDFPIYKNRPSGRQVGGQHAAASTPALPPEEAQKRFTVPEGFEVRLFAAEPEVVAPVAMTWDERGRLWVVELYEYPLGSKPGEKPRDRIKILEDVDGDGRADKVTVFADGLNLATGILIGDGGVYVGQAPHLLFLQDTTGDDKADKQTIVMTGFGREDTHELLNGFTWGPDGWLYMTHGVFTHSKVVNPDNPNDRPVIMTAAVARFHPRTRKFEVFAEGTSNPWGVDFDAAGNAFVSACVIDHLFHMAAGGIYVRQAGTPPHPFAYQQLPSIVDHKHHMAAYAGVQVYQGNQYPNEYQGTILMGNIHDNSIHQDRLTPKGSSFTASFVQDFVRANDGWFRPVSSQVGPDGAVWIMDWYDKYPCYQNANADPEGVDREHGRIWRVVYTGDKKGAPVPSRPAREMNLATMSAAELLPLLEHSNVWQRRQAQRLLSERRDPNTRPALERMARAGKISETRLAALWTLHGAGLLNDAILDGLISHSDPAMRAWVARLTGERADRSDRVMERLGRLAADPDPAVRLAVATACRQFTSGSLTLNTPPAVETDFARVARILARVLVQPGVAEDPLLLFMIWMAAEPGIAANPQRSLNWFASEGRATMPAGAQIVRKTMRRICDMQQPSLLNTALEFVVEVAGNTPAMATAALDGLIEGQRGKAILPSVPPEPLLERLLKHSDQGVAARAQQLGTLWGDTAALQASLRTIQDEAASVPARVQAIQSVKQQRVNAVRDALLQVLTRANPEPVIHEAIRALSDVGGDAVGGEIIRRWSSFSPPARRAASEALASRRQWALPFLDQIGQKKIEASELPVTAIRSLVHSKDESIRNKAAEVLGRFRDSDADKLRIIAEKRKLVLQEGMIDFAKGREVTQVACLTCHKLHGEGAEVGPDLTGVGRSTLDALLAHIIDPNQIIGKGYENVEVETKDGRVISGRLVEDTDTRVKLISAGPREEVIARSEIESFRVSEISVMPEGLEEMPESDFRDMIWYILNPPQDGKALTPERRRELIGEESAAAALRTDGESIALWNPLWKVICPDFEGAPRKYPEYAGRRNVLMTHPFSVREPAALERRLEIPNNGKAVLQFHAAAHEQGDWELRVLANGKLLHKRIVDRSGDRWKRIEVDLSGLAGQSVLLRLENHANDWNWEFAFWSDLRVEMEGEPRTVRLD